MSDQLPNEIRLMMLRYLSRTDVVSSGLVSRDWRFAVLVSLYTRLVITQHAVDRGILVNFILSAFEPGLIVRTLTLGCITLILCCSPHLTELGFTGAVAEPFALRVLDLAQEFGFKLAVIPKLEHLVNADIYYQLAQIVSQTLESIYWNDIQFEPLLLYPKLKSLELVVPEDVNHPNIIVLINLVSALPTLETIKIQSNSNRDTPNSLIPFI